VADLEDISPHRLREIENFFETYKALEGRETDVSGWLGVDDAWRIIDAAMAAGARGVDASGEAPTPGTWR
jgi:inorganic pyrophosphatase